MKLKHKKEIDWRFIKHNELKIIDMGCSNETIYYIGLIFYLYINNYIKDRNLVDGLVFEDEKFCIQYINKSPSSHFKHSSDKSKEEPFIYIIKRVERLSLFRNIYLQWRNEKETQE